MTGSFHRSARDWWASRNSTIYLNCRKIIGY